MRKNITQLIFSSIIALLCLIHTGYAEEAEILTLLKSGEMDKLSLIHENANGAEKLFLDGVFEENGAIAVMIFQDLYDNYKQSKLAWEALERIYQYNYALGYYEKATELELLLQNRPQIQSPDQNFIADNTDENTKSQDIINPPSATSKSLVYWVQCGAFSNSDNAELMATKIRQNGYNVIVLYPESGVRNYYLVRVGGFNNKADASIQSTKIKQQLGIESRVVAEN